VTCCNFSKRNGNTALFTTSSGGFTQNLRHLSNSEYFSTVKPMDWVHGVMDRECGQVHGGPKAARRTHKLWRRVPGGHCGPLELAGDVTPGFKAKPNAHSMCVQESSFHTYRTENGYIITNVSI
jgi:hypothetical protein